MKQKKIIGIMSSGGISMQMCSECMKVYDESESVQCPFCLIPEEEFKYIIVYDEKEGIAKTVPVEEAYKYR